MQCALFISGIWGVFVFKEIVGRRAILAFFVSGAVLLGGAALLGAYGPASPESSNGTLPNSTGPNGTSPNNSMW
jgi:hypothetical protein